MHVIKLSDRNDTIIPVSKEVKMLQVTEPQRKALTGATILALICGFLFLKHYLMLIIIATIIAFLFDPFYKWLQRKGVSDGIASVLTFFAALFCVVIPLIIVSLITISQLTHLVNLVKTGGLQVDLGNIGHSVLRSVNELLAKMGSNHQVTQQDVVVRLSSFVETAGSSFLTQLASSLTSIFSFIATFVIFIFVFFSILRQQTIIKTTIATLNPLGENMTALYLRKISAMTKAMVKGQFIIAIIQGVLSAGALSIAGLPNLFFFFFLLMTVISIIPLGAGIVSIPIGIAMIFFGNVWQGVFVILNHLLVVTTIDNVVRPKLVPKDAQLDPALTMLSVFSGLAMFGFLGIVIGPVIMIVIVTTIQVFLEIYRDDNLVAHDKQQTRRKPLWRMVARSRKT